MSRRFQWHKPSTQLSHKGSFVNTLFTAAPPPDPPPPLRWKQHKLWKNPNRQSQQEPANNHKKHQMISQRDDNEEEQNINGNRINNDESSGCGGGNNDDDYEMQSLLFCLKILYNSLEFFPRNKRISVSLFGLLTLPLSFLLFSFSLSARPIKAHIYHLEALARLAPTRFEARHLWKESRADALSLLRLRLLYFLPSYSLSLLAAVSAVVSAHSASTGKRLCLRSAADHVRLSWKRPLVTTICIYATMLLYSQAVSFTAAVSGAAMLSLAAGLVLEIYVMAVMGVGLVVSVLEDRFGFGAIRVGSRLMEGRRVCGWALSGWFVAITGLIGWRWEQAVVMTMDGGDHLGREKWTVVMAGTWERVLLIALYGVAVLWSYVVTTVFYCECRKRRVIKTQNDTVAIEV